MGLDLCRAKNSHLNIDPAALIGLVLLDYAVLVGIQQRQLGGDLGYVYWGTGPLCKSNGSRPKKHNCKESSYLHMHIHRKLPLADHLPIKPKKRPKVPQASETFLKIFYYTGLCLASQQLSETLPWFSG